MTIRATYRLQLNKDFTLADARAMVPYLDDLGISHLYLSPILMARPGSTHGYDTVDHTRINPELGTRDDFVALVSAARARNMGIILDFVPNHMGVGGADNWLWLDVLKHGEQSQYAPWFDIDWHPPRPGMDGKLLVPFLGTSYAEALQNGQIVLKHDETGFAVWAYDAEKLPLRPEDEEALLGHYGSPEAAIAAHTGTEGHAGSWGALDSLIKQQHWRLVHHAVAADEINYRRFFINSDLAGIRIDRPDVFNHAHQLIFSLIAEGLVDGLRIDHVDGLLDPKGYLEALQSKSPRPIYLLVEKILAPHEQLRSDWPIDGTTGYEVGAQLTRLLTPEEAEEAVSTIYNDFVGPVITPQEEAYLCKLRVMDNELGAELDAMALRFARLAWTVGETADLPVGALRRALRETIAWLTVYRTYIDDQGIDPRDSREIGLAVAKARRSQAHIQPAIFDFVEAVLLGTLPNQYDPHAVAACIGRFQQYTGPAMAKGLEDTALYRFNRLVSLNEVGAHPQKFSVSAEAFHDSNRRRLETHPRCMIATSTHDTKRGEDTRAVISAIADAPQIWADGVAQWRQTLDASDLDPNDLYLFFQLLLGGWPLAGQAPDLGERLKGAMMKSLREARLHSDWAVNNDQYEAAVFALIDKAMENEAFLEQFAQVRDQLAEIGRRKSLIQAALKLTIPGVPDIYRGAEDWEQSFVDPDNRRPVDFAALKRRLADPQAGDDDKLILTHALLELRRSKPDLFNQGAYEALDLPAPLFGFRRTLGSDEVVVMADLSPGHRGGIGQSSSLQTIYGSAEGPVWVLAN